MSKDSCSASILPFILFTGMPLLFLEATRHSTIQEKPVIFLGKNNLARKGKFLVLHIFCVNAWLAY